MNHISYITLFLALFIACKNPAELEVSNYIKGRAVYREYGSAEDKPLANQKVILAYTAGMSVVQEVYTDNQGTFFFSNLSGTKEYAVYTKANVTIYEGATGIVSDTCSGIVPNNDVILLRAVFKTTNATGLFVTVTDSLGGKIGGANIYLYSSSVLAAIDSTYTEAGTLKVSNSNSNGSALISGLPENTLYIKSRYKINDSTMLKSVIVPVIVPLGIDSTTIIVK
jgi:hypothetical protein